MDKAKRCRFEGRKQGCVGWRVAWRGEGMETTVLEQRFKKSCFSCEWPSRRPAYCFITHKKKKKIDVYIQSKCALVNLSILGKNSIWI